MTETAPTVAEIVAAHGVHVLSPHLVCRDAKAAIAFYGRAFGAETLMSLDAPDGTLLHGCVRINGSSVMLVDENPVWGALSPKALNGTPVTIHLMVDDVDGWIERAHAAGARIVMPAEDMFWGDRYGIVEDPFGHHWSIATPVRRMSAEDLQAAATKAMSEGMGGTDGQS
ncbi:MAG: VOC family protein [Alphaproteobacteria bacterium]|nr:VOC family protein [Alphaproteobacteria bacterium]